MVKLYFLEVLTEFDMFLSYLKFEYYMRSWICENKNLKGKKIEKLHSIEVIPFNLYNFFLGTITDIVLCY